MKKEDISSSSSSSDSESDEEESARNERSPPIGETSENQLTLLDDEDCQLLVLPPEGDADTVGYEGEAEETYGEAEEGGESGSEAPGPSEKKKTPIEQEPDKPKKKKKKRKKILYICSSSCKYESVRRCSKRFGFKEVGEDEDWNLYWTDYSVALERVMDMKKYQKINHFPGMSEICRKDLLARNMNRMLKLFPKEYNVFPRSWCLPADYGDFSAYTRQKKHKTYILKPESGCQGKGIWVTKNPKEIKPNEHMLCQQYLSKPFLIDGFKFDLRIYALVTSCDPLRVFVFKDGLARFATAKYIEPSNHNVENVYMHLTNYAINKHSKEFVRDDDDAGSKRRIITINKWMNEKHYDVDKMWNDIDDVIIKTLISAHPILKHNYRTCFPNHIKGSACFEILGFDVLVDKKLKPYLLEVNHSPSFHTDAKLDKEIKEALLYDTLNLCHFGAVDRRKCIEEEKRKIKERLFQRSSVKKESKEDLDKAQAKWIEELEKYEDNHMGNFRRIYPTENMERYEKFFHNSGSLYQETAAFKARSECARQQREEIMRKQEKLDVMKKKKDQGVRPESPGGRRKKIYKRPPVPGGRRIMGSREDLRHLEPICAKYYEDVRVNYTCNKGGKQSQSRYSEITSDMDRSQVPLHPVQSDLSQDSEGFQSSSAPETCRPMEPIDTSKPQDILEEEELERISALLQRDNLVRGLGIVEHVYRLLHCTTGTTGATVKTDKFSSDTALNNPQPQPQAAPSEKLPFNPPKQLPALYHHPKQPPLFLRYLKSKSHKRSKDDSHLSSVRGSHRLPRGKVRVRTKMRGSHGEKDYQYVVPQAQGSQHGKDEETDKNNNINSSKEQNDKSELQAYSTDELVHRASQLNVQENHSLMGHQGYGLNATTLGTLQTYGAGNKGYTHPHYPLVPVPGSQGTNWGRNHQRGVGGGGIGGNQYERNIPLSAYGQHRTRYTNRRQAPSNKHAQGHQMVPDADYKQLAAMIEVEKNETYGRYGFQQRTDSATSNKRTMSATSTQKIKPAEGKLTPRAMGLTYQPLPGTNGMGTLGHQQFTSLPNVVKVPIQSGSQGLSVVSAPAPVVQRPDLGSAGNTNSNTSGGRSIPSQQPPPLDSIPGLRVNKAQRIRGASNNMRVKQLELRENGVILS